MSKDLPPTPGGRAYSLTLASLVLLIALCMAWETVLAPLRPGGSWLMLKALPLLAPLFGILRGRRYTFQWASMLILAYFAEGAVRAWSDTGLSQKLAMAEVVLTTLFFWAAIAYVRRSFSAQPKLP